MERRNPPPIGMGESSLTHLRWGASVGNHLQYYWLDMILFWKSRRRSLLTSFGGYAPIRMNTVAFLFLELFGFVTLDESH